MEENVLPPTTTPPAPPVPDPEPERPGRISCEFCGCRLDTRGNILTRGDGARKYLAQEDEIARLRGELDTANRLNTELSAQVAELRGSSQAKRRILY